MLHNLKIDSEFVKNLENKAGEWSIDLFNHGSDYMYQVLNNYTIEI